MAVLAKSFIDLERANTEVELFALASHRGNVEPMRGGKKEKKNMRKREKPRSKVPRSHPREALEYFTSLNRQISTLLVKMKRRSQARPLMPRKNGQPMRKDVESY